MNIEQLKNTVIQGDCRQVMKDIPDKSIDMILCDLPYGTTACKWDIIIPFEPLWKEYKRIIKDNGAIVLTASQPFTSALVMSNPDMFKYEWVWEKSRPNGFLDANRKPMKKHENILVFYNKLPAYNPQGIILKDKPNKNTGVENVYGKVKQGYVAKITYTNYPNTILEFSSNTNEFHPTQKPVALFEYLIKTYTNEGDLVLDNCAGSGTTGVACKKTGRNFIGIEISPEYCKIAEERLRQEILL
jgi:site-specific DNA-methyltransferase (adenine-specific)